MNIIEKGSREYFQCKNGCLISTLHLKGSLASWSRAKYIRCFLRRATLSQPHIHHNMTCTVSTPRTCFQQCTSSSKEYEELREDFGASRHCSNVPGHRRHPTTCNSGDQHDAFFVGVVESILLKTTITPSNNPQFSTDIQTYATKG